MFDRVLIGLEGSAADGILAWWIRKLFPKSEMILVHAVEASYTYAPASEVSQAQRRLAGIAKELPWPIRTAVGVGSAAAVISRSAEEMSADLIAVFRDARSRQLRHLVGQVTEKLLYGSQVPLLVVPHQAEALGSGPPESAVVPLDGSRVSRMILPMAAEFARERGMRLDLTHVLEDREAYTWLAESSQLEIPGWSVPDWEKALDHREKELRASLEDSMKSIEETGVRAELSFVRGKMPGPLLKHAEERGRGMFVMSAHGYGALTRALLGSMSMKIVQDSRIPVLIARRVALEKMAESGKLAAEARQGL